MRTVIPTISSLVWLQDAPQSWANGQNRALRAILSEHTAPLLPRPAIQPHRMGSESHERCLIPKQRLRRVHRFRLGGTRGLRVSLAHVLPAPRVHPVEVEIPRECPRRSSSPLIGREFDHIIRVGSGSASSLLASLVARETARYIATICARYSDLHGPCRDGRPAAAHTEWRPRARPDCDPA